MTRTIMIDIGADEKMCGACEYLDIFRTGLIDEFHPTCKIFGANGVWGKYDMRRPKICLKAEVKP